jgi:organic radical activating enzyme
MNGKYIAASFGPVYERTIVVNVIINYQCNCHCDYCFAKPFSDSTSCMGVDEFKDILQFLKRSGYSFIRIFGGEPTLHPDLIALMGEADKLFSNFFVLTHGFVEKEITDQLIQFSSARYVCNFAARKFSTRPESDLDHFLKTLGKYVTLGVTYTGDITSGEIDAWIETIQKYNLKRLLRFGIASPDCERSNTFIEFTDEKKKFNEDLQLVARKLFKAGINLAEDCTSIPLCKLDDATIALWKRNFGKDMLTSCAPPSDYMPGKMVSSCFGTAGFTVPLSRYKTGQEFQAYFMRLHTLLENNIVIEPCSSCRYFKVSCFGGCLNNFIAKLAPLSLKSGTRQEIDDQIWLLYSDNEKTLVLKKDDIDICFTFNGIEKMFFDLLVKGTGDIESVKQDSPHNVLEVYNYITN